MPSISDLAHLFLPKTRAASPSWVTTDALGPCQKTKVRGINGWGKHMEARAPRLVVLLLWRPARY